ncbi:MAG: hypothetical protein IV090_08325 [Candidatus Sericytochromatia bacterium]|nr:hypothetical protein [Candidatus Sericytochromatia bacterium]
MKKLNLFMSVLLCTACQLQPQTLMPPGLENLKIIPLQASLPVTQSETVLKVSNNSAHTGKIRVMIGGGTPSFRTQKLHTDVVNIKLYLVPGNTGTQTPLYTSPLIGKTSQNQMFTFENIDSGSYYVAASAYDNTSTNITDISGPNYIQVNDSGIKHAFVSNSGGETAFPGRVTIAPITHLVAETPTLGISLILVAGP